MMKPTEFKDIRLKLKLTQKEMAKQLGITHHHLQKYEYGTVNIPKTIEYLIQIMSKSDIPAI